MTTTTMAEAAAEARDQSRADRIVRSRGRQAEPVADLGLIFGEPAAIDAAVHRARCHWCAIGSPMCRGVSTADRRMSAEFRALRDLLARISAGGETSMPYTRGTRIG